MLPDFGIWEKLKEDEVAGMLATGAKRLEDLKPSENLIRLLGDLDDSRSVLDFGCGAGRNLVGMANLAPQWHVIGYDNAAMVKVASKYLVGKIPDNDDITIVSEWEQVIRVSIDQPFDTIFCCFVLQHIPEPQLRGYLNDFKNVGNELFVYGRRALDPSNTNGYNGGDKFRSVWDVIMESGLEITDAQDGFIESSGAFNGNGNGNEHHWARFKPRGRNVRWNKRRK